MTPEQIARQQIDDMLAESGWQVQDRAQMELGVAIREFPLQSGYADYMLYADGKANVWITTLPGH